MSGRTEPDWNRWDPSLGRVQALPRMALLPMQGSTPDVRFELPGGDGDAGNDVSPSRGDWI
jgi:hypothetical protein